MSNTSLSVLATVVAGILNGSFASPTKYTRHWKWENIWALWAVVAFLLFPWILAWVTIPDILGLYRSVGSRPLIMLVGLGVGFGLGQISFGLGLAVIGIALDFAIAIGIATALGSVVPLITLQPQVILTVKGITILCGVALLVFGIVACAFAGRAKENQFRSQIQTRRARSFNTGLLLAVIAGVLSPLQNFGLAYGQPFLSRAMERGVAPANQANVLWPLFFTAALIPYMTYCVYLWRKNKSFALYWRCGKWQYWAGGGVMGLLWMGGTALYGTASTWMGAMGPILVWPLFMSVIIITSNAWGFGTGEWKGVGRRPTGMMLLGVFFLILGFVTLAYSSRLP